MVCLAELAAICDGRVEGDPHLVICGLASLEQPAADCLSFVVSGQHLPDEFAESPGALLVSEADARRFSGNRIVVPDPYLAYAKISALFCPDRSQKDGLPTVCRIHPTARIADGAELGDGMEIGAGVVVGDGCQLGDRVVLGHNAVIGEGCIVGAGTRIGPSVTLCRHTTIGQCCQVSPGTVIGASGFGYAPEGSRWHKIHQLGGVVIGDEVDIGANTTIDRGTIDHTVIGDRCKLDNQVHIAHNVVIGEDTIMAGCSAVAGSTRIGKRCRIGGRVSILGHLRIADDVTLNAGAFVARSIDTPGTWASMLPAQPARQWNRLVALLNRLGKTRRKPQQDAG